MDVVRFGHAYGCVEMIGKDCLSGIDNSKGIVFILI